MHFTIPTVLFHHAIEWAKYHSEIKNMTIFENDGKTSRICDVIFTQQESCIIDDAEYSITHEKLENPDSLDGNISHTSIVWLKAA